MITATPNSEESQRTHNTTKGGDLMSTVNRYITIINALTTRTAVLDLITALAVNNTVSNTEFTIIYGHAIDRIQHI